MRQQSKHELVTAQRTRYRQAGRAEKRQMRDELVAATGYHRKHVGRLFRTGASPARAGPGGRPRWYDAVVVGALREVTRRATGCVASGWTDVATGWTECVGGWGKGQAAVFAAVEQARERLPRALLGIDADNGSEFLKQKNWSIVRRLLGYDRYTSEAALAALQAVYAVLHRWMNRWQPVLKLVAKERAAAKVRKRYDTAQTPYRRVLAWGGLRPEAMARLQAEQASTGPQALWQQGEATRAALWQLDVRSAQPGAWR